MQKQILLKKKTIYYIRTDMNFFYIFGTHQNKPDEKVISLINFNVFYIYFFLPKQ